MAIGRRRLGTGTRSRATTNPNRRCSPRARTSRTASTPNTIRATTPCYAAMPNQASCQRILIRRQKTRRLWRRSRRAAGVPKSSLPAAGGLAPVAAQYMSSPPCAAAAGFSSLGFSATRASLVSSRVATLAAFCRAVRVTLVGSITPALTMSS